MTTNHLITPEEVGKYSRPISTHIDKDVLDAYIREVEELDIRPVFGDQFLLDIMAKPEKPQYKRLLEGWNPDNPWDETYDHTFGHSTEAQFNAGLKMTVAYYVLARYIKGEDLKVTRSGTVRKNLDYSQTPQRGEKRSEYGEICNIADRYLAQVIEYLRAYPKRYPLFAYPCNNHRPITNNRSTFKVLGD